MTAVISVRGRDLQELARDPSFVYVGRRCGGWKFSPFGNPYVVGRHGPRGDCLRRFEADMDNAIEEIRLGVCRDKSASRYFWNMAKALPSLEGHTLGCWCGFWEPGGPDLDCHAVVLWRLANPSGARRHRQQA